MKMLLLLLLVSQHASGVEVEVYEGVESVLLPCQVSADVSSESTAAVWDLDELKVPTVHVRLQRGDDFEDQNDRYSNRTSMRADALQTGDLSLTLRNPTGSDSGTYTCIFRKYGQDQSRTEVQLKVKEPPVVWPIVLSAVLVPVVLITVLVGVCLHCRYKQLKDKEVVQVLVDSGAESVQLKCKGTVHLPKTTVVVWKDRNDRTVHMYHNGSDHPDKQHRRYRGRAEVNEDLLKTGVLHLTLKYPTHTDRDTYTCTFYKGEVKEENILMERQVELKVKDCRVVELEEGAESVLLPFKTTENLPKDSEVVWKCYEPEYRKVHVYDKGFEQPDRQDAEFRGRTEMNADLLRTGNLSLTLKHPTKEDSGRYSCEVNSKEAWRYKRVWFTVKEKNPAQNQPEEIRKRSSSIDPSPVMADEPV